MKITVDVDCTPEEALRFLGLPDISAVHEAYVDKMRSAVADGVGPEYVSELMKSWAPMGENAFAMWKTMLDQMGNRKT